MISLDSRTATTLLAKLFSDIACNNLLHKAELAKDFKTILERTSNEGLSFLTISLPRIGKAVLSSFETGKFELPEGFKAFTRNAALPRFLWVLLSEIYATDGELRADADVPSIAHVLQITLLCYKLKLPVSVKQLDSSLSKYKLIECELDELVLPSNCPVLNTAQDFISEVFMDWETSSCIPRHGPGSVASREVGREKWSFKRKFETAEPIFPAHENFFVNALDCWDRQVEYSNLENVKSGTSRMCAVPKDSRGPRLISIEPLELQYLQQGMRIEMQRILETHPLTRGRVNFADQSINGKLAQESSVTGRFATLDMSDASDRISKKLVQRLMAESELLDALIATRSTHTTLPNSETAILLHKMSPMGSAVCFPVESIIHYALAVAAIHCCHNIPVKQIVGRVPKKGHLYNRSYAKRSLVYVYGDDLIIDTRYVDCVLKYFPTVGLKFNVGKCFIRGNFRESCGINAYKGEDVTPIYWRKPWTKERDLPDWLESQLELAHGLYSRFYCKAAEYIYSLTEEKIGKLPINPVNRNVAYLTRKSRLCHFPLVPRKYLRANHDHQTYQTKVKMLRLRKPKNQKPWDGPTRLLQALVGGSGEQAVPGTALITRWMDI